MKIESEYKILIEAETLQKRIKELGEKITEDFRDKDLIVVGVLKGSFVFLSDLSKHIDVPCVIDFLGVSSYGIKTESSGVVKITSDLTYPIVEKDVLIVEDIVDTGLTMNYLLENLKTRMPRSIKICTLLHKPENTIKYVPLDYVGFTIENKFVFGYGLDLFDKYRNLPFIAYLK